MSSSVQRFLTRRDRRSKVFLPFSYPSFLPWRRSKGGLDLEQEDQEEDRNPQSFLFDPSFSLDGAGSIRRSRKRPPSAYITHSTANATTANSGFALTLQSVPDAGAFGGMFVPEEKKKLDKDEEKRVSRRPCLLPPSLTETTRTDKSHSRSAAKVRHQHLHRSQCQLCAASHILCRKWRRGRGL